MGELIDLLKRLLYPPSDTASYRDTRRQRASASSTKEDLAILAGNNEMKIAGVMFYQKALESVSGGRTENSHELDMLAKLRPDPYNLHDQNAVAVVIHGHKVGHLPRESAALLHSPIVELGASLKKSVGCRAKIIGGWDRGGKDIGNFGVRLYFNPKRLRVQPGEPQPVARRPNAPLVKTKLSVTPRQQRSDSIVRLPASSEATPESRVSRAERLSPPGTLRDGKVKGRHYTKWVERIRQLKREGRLDEAIALLRQCADATEDQNYSQSCGVAPWYFEHLAICFRKQKEFPAEVAVLERYARLHPSHMEEDWLEHRLEKARLLRAKQYSR